MNLEDICLVLELSKTTMKNDKELEWLGCYSCDGYKTNCMMYFNKGRVRKNE